MYHTDKYNITGVDKTVKCACISELWARLKNIAGRQENHLRQVE
jgi:hypothetical protein